LKLIETVYIDTNINKTGEDENLGELSLSLGKDFN